MAAPLRTTKRSVDLAAAAPLSRIRRDPPPADKRATLHDRNERDKRNAVIGILLFTFALLAIALGFSSSGGWSPSQHEINIVIAEPE